MNSPTSGSYFKAFGYAIAAQTEGVVFCMAAVWGGKWLNVNYPRDFKWEIVTFSIAFVGICHSFYLVIRILLRLDKSPDK